MSKEIKLSLGKSAIVDDGYQNSSRWKWRAITNGKHWYAARNEGGKTILMHREIMSAPTGMEVDHINGNSLDNRRENLRICTHSENSRNHRNSKNNVTGYNGVVWNKGRNKYQAQIRVDGDLIYLGLFKTAEAAARIYDVAAMIHYGEFAVLNFPGRVR